MTYEDPRGRALWRRVDTLWAASAAALTTLAAILLSTYLFGRIPHVQDSIAQLFQARIFAGGRLWAPAPPVPEIFDYTHMILQSGRWYSQYPPGHSLMLLPGVLAGVPWVVNPLLGGLTVFGLYAIGFELYGRRVARLAALLGLVSPFLLLMSAGFMSHASALFALTFFLLFTFRLLRTSARRDGLLAGCFLALAILIRPYSAFAVALPAGIYALALLFRGGASGATSWRTPLILTAGAAAVGGLLLLLYNWATTGSPLQFGYSELGGPGLGLGFGKGAGLQGHTLVRGLRFSWDRLSALNGRLFEWPLTSLWPIAIALLLTHRPRRWLLASFPAALLAAYVFYWYQDANDCFGPRYIYEALTPVLVLSAVGILVVTRRLISWFSQRPDPSAGDPGRGASRSKTPGGCDPARYTLLTAVVLVLLLTGAGALWRWPILLEGKTGGASRTAAYQDAQDGTGAKAPTTHWRNPFECYGRDYWGVTPDLGEAAARLPGRALVFVDTRVPSAHEESRRRAARHLLFGSAFAHQRPYLDSARVIFVHLTPFDWKPETIDKEAALASLVSAEAARFPGREAYLYRPGWESLRPLRFRKPPPAGTR